MGKNQSKEQVVIAQSGANVSGIETQLAQFSILMGAVLIVVMAIAIFCCYRKCQNRAKKWLFRQIIAAAPAARAVPPATPLPHPKIVVS